MLRLTNTWMNGQACVSKGNVSIIKAVDNRGSKPRNCPAGVAPGLMTAGSYLLPGARQHIGVEILRSPRRGGVAREPPVKASDRNRIAAMFGSAGRGAAREGREEREVPDQGWHDKRNQELDGFEAVVARRVRGARGELAANLNKGQIEAASGDGFKNRAARPSEASEQSPSKPTVTFSPTPDVDSKERIASHGNRGVGMRSHGTFIAATKKVEGLRLGTACHVAQMFHPVYQASVACGDSSLDVSVDSHGSGEGSFNGVTEGGVRSTHAFSPQSQVCKSKRSLSQCLSVYLPVVCLCLESETMLSCDIHDDIKQ